MLTFSSTKRTAVLQYQRKVSQYSSDSKIQEYVFEDSSRIWDMHWGFMRMYLRI